MTPPLALEMESGHDDVLVLWWRQCLGQAYASIQGGIEGGVVAFDVDLLLFAGERVGGALDDAIVHD